jgi:hypothetical protein
VWVNNVTVQEARKAIEAGAGGCTQNPSFVWKMLESDPENTLPLLDGLLDAESDDNEVLILLQKALIERVAKEFYPLYERIPRQMRLCHRAGRPLSGNRWGNPAAGAP